MVQHKGGFKSFTLNRAKSKEIILLHEANVASYHIHSCRRHVRALNELPRECWVSLLMTG